MAFSDDEEETLPHTVSEYYFCSEQDEPLSFFELPVQWNGSESSDCNHRRIFLRGDTDNGLQKIYKQVKAWKYDISKAQPEISVLSKDNNWIKLQKPRKSYENEIKTILIIVHCLHFFKSRPKASEKALWEHLSYIFRSYDIGPCKHALIDHLEFIREAVMMDETIAKSKFPAIFLDRGPRKRKVLSEDAEITLKPSFIVDGMHDEAEDDDKEAEESDSEKEDDVFDSLCAICDNGGNLICCDGECLRSFHATMESAESSESNCESLCLPAKLPEKQIFYCANCGHNQHQCYICGELGSSDKSSVAEVFRCSSATCGQFYHPLCVASLLHQLSEAEPQDLEEKIAAGEPFTCPAHKCFVCKQPENEKYKDLQFAVCRRCPRSYHRKCLPREIIFFNEDNVDDVKFRAWDYLLPKSRALIYCLDHEIIDELGTPVRNIKFPDIGCKKKDLTLLGEDEQNQTAKTTGKESYNLPPLDSDSKKSILALMEESAPSLSLRKSPSTHAQRDDISIMLGRVDGSEESQDVARDFGAVCTPEFFLFKKDGRRPFELVYHGQFDDSRPSNNLRVTGRDLSLAIDSVLSGQPVPSDKKPSIKWHPETKV